MKRTFQITNSIAFIVMLAFNYLASSGLIRDVTVGEVSEKYQNYFTPADYAFAIWGLIYFLLAGYILFQWKIFDKVKADNHSIVAVGWWFTVSCLVNSAWLIAWILEYIAISTLLMVLLLFSLFAIIEKLKPYQNRTTLNEKLFVVWPFSVYAGWVSVALIANIAALLTKEHWNGWQIAETNWAVLMIFIAVLLNLYMIIFRHMYAYALTGIWALVAIAVANRGKEFSIVNAALLASGILITACGVEYFREKRRVVKT